ncbi:MAG TPA: glycerophosphodiester phosphodiesterase [Burkholderiaceae bacterium]
MNVSFGEWPYRRRVAHRGAGKLAPENTLAAIRKGASLGYRMFEFDAKLSGDGVAVLMHDALVDRTTNGSGRVAGMSFAELAQLDAGSWHSPEYAGEGVPTLARVAAWLTANHLHANVEIKPCPGREVETGGAIALEARRLWRDAEVPPLLSSFSPRALEAARGAAPELPRGLVVDNPALDWLALCAELGCVSLNAHHVLLDRDVIDRAHGAGLRVVCYGVGDPERAEQLFDWGLDCLITPAVELIEPD